MTQIEKGDLVQTPRFCSVRIEKVFTSYKNAEREGYNETTHYAMRNSDGYDVLGKHIGPNRMAFAAVKL